MKKILFSLFALPLVLGFSSCQETWDDAPKLDGHVGTVYADFLNQPAMQDQYLMITQDNREGYFHLTCSQPYYGYAAIATYMVQVSLSEDFTEYEEITQAFSDCANINPLNGDVATAMEKLANITSDKDLPMNYQRIYMRLRAFIAQSPDDTEYISNAVHFDNIGVNYFAIWTPGEAVDIYMRGGFDPDWAALPAWQFVTGDAENTWVIPHDVTLTAGVEFKVADAKWGPLNLGAGDSNVVKPNEAFPLAGGDNPGNLTVENDFTGKVQLSLEKGAYYLILETADAE